MTGEELIQKYLAGERDFMGADLSYANLIGANFAYANFRVANLVGADLWHANLYGVKLDGVNLNGANLEGVNLYGAHLDSANLSNTDLRCANFESAYIVCADLTNAKLPSPTMILLADWGKVTDQLCAQLMRYDAENHPNPESFVDWVKGGPCPYDNINWQRSANFKEKKELYRPGKALSALKLATMLLKKYTVF